MVRFLSIFFMIPYITMKLNETPFLLVARSFKTRMKKTSSILTTNETVDTNLQEDIEVHDLLRQKVWHLMKR